MKIQTMSIVCGTTACNAKCPFCVSKTTPKMQTDDSNYNHRNLIVACRLAQTGGATTCLITGKGEPTLYSDLVSVYVGEANRYFPLIELQTNGILLKDSPLKEWYLRGLTTVCLSTVSLDPIYNEEIYGHSYVPIQENIDLLHKHGFSVRLSVILVAGYGYDCVQGIDKLVYFCKRHKVEQLTVRAISKPEDSKTKVAKWIEKNAPTDKSMHEINMYVDKHATPVLHLSHGATVYDFDGQNICLTNCLTTNDTDENIRQIIFYPDGTISYDWKYKGARLL